MQEDGHAAVGALDLDLGHLKSAVANAENNYSMDVESLYVSQVFATAMRRYFK